MGKNYLSEMWVSVLFVAIFVYLIVDIVKNIRKIRRQQSQTPPVQTYTKNQTT